MSEISIVRHPYRPKWVVNLFFGSVRFQLDRSVVPESYRKHFDKWPVEEQDSFIMKMVMTTVRVSMKRN